MRTWARPGGLHAGHIVQYRAGWHQRRVIVLDPETVETGDLEMLFQALAATVAVEPPVVEKGEVVGLVRLWGPGRRTAAARPACGVFRPGLPRRRSRISWGADPAQFVFQELPASSRRQKTRRSKGPARPALPGLYQPDDRGHDKIIAARFQQVFAEHGTGGQHLGNRPLDNHLGFFWDLPSVRRPPPCIRPGSAWQCILLQLLPALRPSGTRPAAPLLRLVRVRPST